MLPPHPQGDLRGSTAHPRPAPDYIRDKDLFFRVVRGGFALRRKTLLNSLATCFPFSKEDLAGCIAAAGLPADIRGERLGLREFAALSDQISALE